MFITVNLILGKTFKNLNAQQLELVKNIILFITKEYYEIVNTIMCISYPQKIPTKIFKCEKFKKFMHSKIPFFLKKN